MESQQPTSSQQQQSQIQTQQQPTQASTKNVKNLSIKDFFTTRLMRARSFETGNQSPKDEIASNWFDEFKARMTKKSQANQASKQAALASGSFVATLEENEDEAIAAYSNNDGGGVRFNVPQSKYSKHHQQSQNKDENISPLVKSTCDSTQVSSKSTESSNDLMGQVSYDESSPTLPRDNIVSRNRGQRERKLQRISSVSRPDFDAASINTIVNRRDSRYDLISKKPQRLFLSRILTVIKQVITFSLPFNYNLPWKLLSLVNFTFVIIVIGFTSETYPDIMAFNFFNGFICGLLAATLCFIILAISLMVQILPKSSSLSSANPNSSIQASPSKSLNLSLKSKDFNSEMSYDLSSNTIDPSSLSSKQTPNDFSCFEVLSTRTSGSGSEPDSATGTAGRNDNILLEDDDYKGWMIEFIGDYELRNKSDIKLKLMFVKLENRTLYLCKPKNSHDAESSAFPVFVQQRVYDLSQVSKFTATLLLPKNVRNRQKWVWSKKYPIRLEFQNDAALSEQPLVITSKRTEPENLANVNKSIQLTLFAKSCREKEEWFRRFKRIVEESKLAQIQANRRASQVSDLSGFSEHCGLLGPMKACGGTACRSASPSSSATSRHDCVQTSRSSHILNDSRKMMNDCESNKLPDSSSNSNLVRTKSCELLHADQTNSTTATTGAGANASSDRDGVSGTKLQFYSNRFETTCAADDSTLTRETAELFSQAIENSNFLESRPNLNYRDYIERVIDSSSEATPTSDWFNALTGRIFFDVFSHNYWSVWFKRKIQRKLHRIRLPYFMETLTLTKIDLGENAPQFLNVVSHNFDSFGLSIDFDMAYSGGLTMTFETKLNLLKIKADNSSSSNSNSAAASQSCANVSSSSTAAPTAATSVGQSAGLSSQSQNETSSKETGSLSDSSLEASSSKEASAGDGLGPGVGSNSGANVVGAGAAGVLKINTLSGGSKPTPLSSSGSARTSGESSDSYESDSDSDSSSSVDDADVDEISDWEDYGAEKTRQSIVRFVDKIASSRYFQQATENRYIKKKLQDISNCPLVLIVKIQSLNGVLTLNVPPPPTDRVWYGFKPNPELTLKALPKMGDREVNLSHVTDWIERKLAEEFRKILVIPNMEDFVLPVLKSDHLLYVTSTK